MRRRQQEQERKTVRAFQLVKNTLEKQGFDEKTINKSSYDLYHFEIDKEDIHLEKLIKLSEPDEEDCYNPNRMTNLSLMSSISKKRLP